ncbi:hypothetical protein HRbin02_01945 [Candidatus Calditenuaceae archaeon HR02]|nr:hypothetical protein HRbin02_01945 [Candidatus Calditenuaceae archaeon HR02]
MEYLIEGDYIYVSELGFMAVKGVSHPPGKVVAFPRLRRGAALEEVYAFIEDRVRGWLVFDDHSGQVLPQIPIESVERHLSSLEGFRSLQPIDRLTSTALELGRTLSDEGGFPQESIGISGSILLKAHKRWSDIDIVLVEPRGFRAVEALKELRARGVTGAVTREYAQDLASKRRDSKLGLEVWLMHEGRKSTYGLFRGVVYSAKIVQRPEDFWEPWGTARWRELGYVEVRGVVEEDSLGCYTPMKLKVTVDEVLKGGEEAYRCGEVVSYRSRFAEQVFAGERFTARGRLEIDLITGGVRIFVGNMPEDYIISENVMRKIQL